jgi:hypothetical protein
MHEWQLHSTHDFSQTCEIKEPIIFFHIAKPKCVQWRDQARGNLEKRNAFAFFTFLAQQQQYISAKTQHPLYTRPIHNTQ